MRDYDHGPEEAASAPRRVGAPFRVLRREMTPANASAPRMSGRAGIDLRSQPLPAASHVRRVPRGRPRPRPRPQSPHGMRATIPPALAIGVGQLAGTARAASRGRRLSPRLRLELVVLALVQGAIIGLVWWALTAPTWQVRQIRVDGTDDPRVVAAIQALPLTGCDIFRCDLARETRLIAALPFVAHAEVHAAYPDGLVVLVTLRRPALLWRTHSQTYVLAEDGTVLAVLPNDAAAAYPSLPEVSDDAAVAFAGRLATPGQHVSPVFVKMAEQLLSDMPKTLGAGWALAYTDANGFVAATQAGTQVLFGTPDQAAQVFAASKPDMVGTPADVATARGAAFQLTEAREMQAMLVERGRQVAVIDVRWGLHPYLQPGG